jgi:hypothetical protein
VALCPYRLDKMPASKSHRPCSSGTAPEGLESSCPAASQHPMYEEILIRGLEEGTIRRRQERPARVLSLTTADR